MRCDGSFDESLPRQTKSFSWGVQSQETLNCSPQIDLAKVDPGKIALVLGSREKKKKKTRAMIRRNKCGESGLMKVYPDRHSRLTWDFQLPTHHQLTLE